MKQLFSTGAFVITLLLFTFVVNATETAAIADGAVVAVATVVSVDEKTRDITLAGPEGDHFVFTAGPEVRNFAQIKRGDRVLASYFQGFALGLGPKGSGVKDRVDSMEVERAKKGEKPGVMLSKTIVAIGVVKDVDKENRIVVLEGAENTVALEVSEDVNMAEIAKGSEVEAVYIESYAVNIIPAPKVSGTVTLESTSIAVGVGVTWGHGVFTMHDGSTHKFKVSGLSIVDVGVSKINATGEVFNLVELSDLSGDYAAGEVGITIVEGGSATAMKNSKGVVMHLQSNQQGLKLTIAPAGMSVELVE